MLTETAIKKAVVKATRYKLADGHGLYVAVMPTGKKVFRYEYRFHGRRETLTLGTYSDTGKGMTLVEARHAHAAARKLAEQGESPAGDKRRRASAMAFKLGTHFEGIARAWVDQLTSVRSPSWTRVVKRLLERDIYPVIGALSLSEITQAEVLDSCKRAQDRGSAYTAEWIRRTISAVFQYAASSGLTDRNPARAARGAIAVPATESKPALGSVEIRDLVKAIREGAGRPGTRIALELLLHTFVRKAELIRATWDELDLQAAEWRIPAHRMKMREAHLVPLSLQARNLFEKAKEYSSASKFVFPSLASLKKPLSDTALNNALRRLGYEHFSPHGFRRTASTILNEKGWRPDVIERQLAHTERNKIRAAYNKALYVEERKRMMQDWSDHVSAIVDAVNVTPIGRGRNF